MHEAKANKNEPLLLQIREYFMEVDTFDLVDFGYLNRFFLTIPDYEGAQWAGTAYFEAGGEELMIRSGLALAYLYNGQESEAMAIYQSHLTITDPNGKTGRDFFLKDLNDTTELEVKDPEAVARVRAFLENL